MQNGKPKFDIQIQKRAELEIDEISHYYESLSVDLGTKFYSECSEYIDTLKDFPFFANKYNIIRNLPLKKFPYTVHFQVDEFENIVYIESKSCDYQNPSNTRIKF